MSFEDHIVPPVTEGALASGEPGLENRATNVPDTRGLHDRLLALEHLFHKFVFGDDQQKVDEAQEHLSQFGLAVPDVEDAPEMPVVDERVNVAQRDLIHEGQVIPHANESDASGTGHPHATLMTPEQDYAVTQNDDKRPDEGDEAAQQEALNTGFVSGTPAEEDANPANEQREEDAAEDESKRGKGRKKS